MARRFVIVGASVTGATAAITLSEEGAEGTVTLISAEHEPPYERPPLSKAYLRGEAPFDKTLVRPAAFYAEHGIETMLGTRVTRIDSSARFVELEDHRRVPFDALLIATGGGSRPRKAGLKAEARCRDEQFEHSENSKHEAGVDPGKRG
jgi:3-phenylpropionate/trans-cinnamate dioxygenase ferredoxin reductase component